MSTTTSIKCPKCGHQFDAREALEHSILDGQAEMAGRIEAISNTVLPDIALLDLAEPSEINRRQHSIADINGTDT
jgi:hypothetical protein